MRNPGRVELAELRFHHCRALNSVRFDVITAGGSAQRARGHAASEACDWGDPPHELILRDRPRVWLKAKLGFWPLFLAVGGSDAVSIETGYLQEDSKRKVLFSYAAIQDVVLLDHVAWHAVQDAVLMSDDGHPVPNIDEQEERAIFRRDLNLSDWLLRAAADPGSVLAVTPQLDLRAAARISCHSESVRERLLALGFEPSRVYVWTPIPSWAGAGPEQLVTDEKHRSHAPQS